MEKLIDCCTVAKQLGIDRHRVAYAMTTYVQTNGKNGLRCVLMGRRRVTRGSWVENWIEGMDETGTR